MAQLFTCKHFLQELNDFLDETLDPNLRSALEKHVSECPDCWVIFKTTEKTLKVFKGMEPPQVPPRIEARLLQALARKT
jgi:Putative zinc-finger